MKPKFTPLKLLFIIGTIIAFGVLILFFYKDKKALSVVLTTLSGCAVIYAIIFEGQLKRENEDGSSKLTWIGILLIILYISVSVGNGINARSTIDENERSSKQDSLNTEKIISDLKLANEKLEAQRVKDSANITDLKHRLALIDTTLILNTLKELEEQRKAVEKQNNNTFLLFKNEVKDNIETIVLTLSDKDLDGFKNDTAHFIATNLTNTYIKQYQTISQNDVIVDYLFELSKYIDNVNKFADQALARSNNLEAKRLNINNMKKYTKLSRTYLTNIFTRTETFTTYQQYENIDFSKEFKPYNDTIIENHFKITYLLKQGGELIEMPPSAKKNN